MIRFGALLVIAGVGLSLAACETVGDAVEATGRAAASAADAAMSPFEGGGARAVTVAAAPRTGALGPDGVLVIPPIFGAPEPINTALPTMVLEAAGLAPGGAAGSVYTLRGAASAAAGTRATSMLVNWTLIGPGGETLNNFGAATSLPMVEANAPWSLMDRTALQDVAGRTAEALRPFLISQQRAVATAAPLASPKPEPAPAPPTPELQPAPPSTPVPDQAVAAPELVAAPAPTPEPAPQFAAPQFAALEAGGNPGILVKPVTGAPGDGDVMLTKALRDSLSRSDAPLVEATSAGAGPAPYVVTANVTTAPVGGGMEQVEIVWILNDPLGGLVGEVRQQNVLPAGKLEQGWGQDAVYAASAATDGLVTLWREAGETLGN